MQQLTISNPRNSFIVGEKFSFGGKIYSNGVEISESSASFSPALGSVLSHEGVNVVTVSFRGQSATYRIQVLQRSVKGGIDISYGLLLGECAMRGDLDMDGHAIKNINDPVDDQDVVTKHYIESHWPTEITPVSYDASLPAMNGIKIGNSDKYRLVPQGDTAGAVGALAIGDGSVASADGAVAIGHGAVSSAANTVSFDTPNSSKTIAVNGPENIFFKKSVSAYPNGFNLKQYTDAKNGTRMINDPLAASMTIQGTADLVGENARDIISFGCILNASDIEN